MNRDELKRYRRVTVMGLGLFGGGAGVARYFAGLGAEVTVTDMADAAKLAKSVASLDVLGIRFVLGEHRPEDFTDTDLVVANQAVRPDNPHLAAAREAGVPIATETGLALALNRSPWVGVTGSSGKSTTTALLWEILRRHDPDAMLGGNIGGDLLTRIEDRPETSPVAVELSSFQLTYLAEGLASGVVPPPRVAVVTNLSPNHLDWHKDMDEYVAAKRNLLRHQTADDWSVLNVDDPVLREWAERTPARVIRCGIDDPGGPDACFGKGLTLRLGGEIVFRPAFQDSKLLGRHNLYNIAQAAAAAAAMGAGHEAVQEGIREFAGLPHRLENVGVGPRNVLFVNDSKSTTPEAAVTALKALDDRPIVLIAGGYDKKSPFEELGSAIQERASALVLLGVSAPRIREAVTAAAKMRPEAMKELAVVECGEDFERAVNAAFHLAPEGGAVLLSPACASWGMFTNYEERGDRFRDLAGRLGATC